MYISPAIPAVIVIIPARATGPASAIRIAASANIHMPAAAAPTPTPAPRIFFAMADIIFPALPIPFAAAGAVFPAFFIVSTKSFTDPTVPDMTLKAANPAATAGIKAMIFSNGATLSSPRKST